MSTEISTVDSTATLSHRAATTAAGLCRELVVRTAMKIQGRRYVQVEGWQAIANAFGCVASARSVERVEGGYRATGQVVRVSDGTVICEAEGFVGDDESMWAKRPVYARRAMAQTRAISRACRSAFAFVVTLMDAGLETTPAEEMAGVVDADPVAVRPKFASPDPVKAAAEAIAAAGSVERLESLRRRAESLADSGEWTAEQLVTVISMIEERAAIMAEGVPA